MINLLELDDSQLNQTAQLLKVEFIKRGWQVKIPYIGSPHMFIDRGDGKETHIFSATPPTTDYAAAHLANDKFATYQVLNQHNVRQPETIMIDSEDNLSEALDLMTRAEAVVVKPIDGGHGKGITVNVATRDNLVQAIDYARGYSNSNKRVIIQEQYSSSEIHDVRVLCIDYKYVASILRVPARVWGDGKATVRQLIESENATERRGVAYRAPLATIDIMAAEKYLGAAINSVPQLGEQVCVLGTANYGTGGETVDVTDDIPPWIRDEAIKASQASGLAVAGVDFLMKTIPYREASPADLDALVIEINKCPALMIHDRPTSGIPRGAVMTYVEYLASL